MGALEFVADVDRVVKSGDALNMAPHLILQAWWSETAAGIETQTTPESALTELETRFGVTLPNDFRKYLSCGVPISENWDAEDGNWWPIERIKSVPEECKHPVSDPVAKNAAKHLIFLDYFIWAWAWGISCVDDETYGKVVLIGEQTGYVAESFEDFVNRYTTDWMSVSQVPRAAKPIGRFRTWLRNH
ncbi:SMI1/KNR4 family protein [Sphingomonas sp. dw_22]|uniref:SMI1/KNR4 family protein n=1 Tax=Sphingomonas sp. dw_22 TaxID=2721175 RepID=UPI001BD5EB25